MLLSRRLLRLVSLATLSACLAQNALAETIRFKDMTSAQLEAMMNGEADVTVEFAAGDLLPLQVRAEGDLLVTETPATIELKVAERFFIRAVDDDLLMSRDGINYLPAKDAVTGRLSASANAGTNGRVSGLTINLDARYGANNR